jgi:proteic killer suppression protein
MIIYFATEELLKLYETPLSNMKGKQKFSRDIIKQYKKKVQLLIAIPKLENLSQFRSLNFEQLKGNKKGQCSIRLNDQYRLILVQISDRKLQIVMVNEISKHYE